LTIDYAKYRDSPLEKARIADLLRILPRGRQTILDIGARDGYISRLLTDHFSRVTALDLKKPDFAVPGVDLVAGDVTCLAFPDNSFDVVCCLEVLEHIRPSQLQKACLEIARVARNEVIIGVPYHQDTRIGRTICSSCKQKNPPWGHVNSFDEHRLLGLFPALKPVSTTFVGQQTGKTNSLSAFLMDIAGNPWGTYNQEEPCIFCGCPLSSPKNGSGVRKLFGALAVRLNEAQSWLASPSPIWLHIVFRKR